MKGKIFIDFDEVLNTHKDWQNGSRFKPKRGSLKYLQKLTKNYKIYVFTTRNRENVYKWLIRYHLDAYIADVVNKREDK